MGIMNENEDAPDGREDNGVAADPARGGDERVRLLEAELADAKDRVLRALADTENLRRRAEREREQEKRYAAANFARDLLNVADNLRRALDSMPAERAQDELTRTLLAGVAATERELLGVFERNGLQRIEPQPGERFDHNVHQAMFEIENTGLPAGSIARVLQPGYVMHERLLRPAMVGVAKGEAPPPGAQPRVDTIA
jgi:molecular chaperone GrpE